jgi:hypothetical protein
MASNSLSTMIDWLLRSSSSANWMVRQSQATVIYLYKKFNHVFTNGARLQLRIRGDLVVQRLKAI